MNDDLITSKNVSIDLLSQLFDAAYWSVSKRGNSIEVGDGSRTCMLRLDEQDEDTGAINAIIIYYPLQFNPNCKAMPHLLVIANDFNSFLTPVRMIIRKDHNMLVVDHWLILDGGVTKKAVVLAAKRFITQIPFIAKYLMENGVS